MTEQNASSRMCLYCAEEKPNTEFSLEHIFPGALGGKACGDFFKTRAVCKKCNNLIGLYADAAFIKSWFTANGAADSAFRFLDPVEGGLVPYTHIGLIESLSDDNSSCEFWVGLSGENVYARYPRAANFETCIGGDPRLTKRIGRDVIIFGTTQNPYWQKVGLLSFADFFSYGRRYAGNVQMEPGQDTFGIFMEPDADGTKFINSINAFRASLDGNPHPCKFSILEDFSDRFLSKFSLGLGYSLFGEDYILTPYAQELRNSMWAKSAKERSKFRVRGVGYWHQDTRLDSIFSIPGSHTIVLERFGEDVGLIAYVHGKRIGIIVISGSFSALKRNCPFDLDTGVVFVIVPARRICTSPIPLPNFVAHKTGSYKHPELSHIESLAVGLKDLPPR